MAVEWRDATLGEFVTLQRGHDLTDTARRPGTVPVFGAAGQNGFHDTAIARGPGIVVGRSGASFGRVHYCKTDFWPHNTGLYVTDFRGNNPRFAFYLLKAVDFSRYNSGSAQPSLNRNFIYPIEIRIPPLDEQRAIAHILGALDDKIQLNQHMNESLESMARALFKSWFVDFDPVRAKAEGRSLHLPRQFTKFFPESFETSELGVSPKGWRVASIGELCRRVAMGPFGSDIKTANFVEAGVPIVRGSNLADGFVENSFVFLTEQKADELRNANAFPGDIVITHRGTLGQVGLIPPNSRFPRYVVSQSQMLLAVDQGLSTSRYVFDFLQSPIGQHALLANTSQTGVPAIARPTTSVKAIRLIAPPIQVLAAFDQLVKPIYMRRDRSIGETRTLRALRDSLLTKLVSGDLRIKSAERLLRGNT
jgi:type I restriction enzyme, S subunit